MPVILAQRQAFYGAFAGKSLCQPSPQKRFAREVVRRFSHHHVREERIPGRFRETVLLAAAHIENGSHNHGCYTLGLKPNTFSYSSIMIPLTISATSLTAITLSKTDRPRIPMSIKRIRMAFMMWLSMF